MGDFEIQKEVTFLLLLHPSVSEKKVFTWLLLRVFPGTLNCPRHLALSPCPIPLVSRFQSKMFFFSVNSACPKALMLHLKSVSTLNFHITFKTTIYFPISQASNLCWFEHIPSIILLFQFKEPLETLLSVCHAPYCARCSKSNVE